MAEDLILSLIATLPSDGVASSPPEVFEDTLHLKNLGHFGRSPRNISSDIMEGVRFYEYKKPFYYNKRPTAQDPNPGDDGTLGSYNEIATGRRRRSTTGEVKSSYVPISEGHKRRKRMLFQAFSLAYNFANGNSLSTSYFQFSHCFSNFAYLLFLNFLSNF